MTSGRWYKSNVATTRWDIRKIALWCGIACAAMALFGAWPQVKVQGTGYAIGLALGGLILGGGLGAITAAVRNMIVQAR